ncbi:MAG TPA: flagellar biosynthetic protein FliR, partial [Thiopseudomonas sp.]|nr:flagellar biosynthetic protein FliR [Thiopseudomonas sp.]
MLELSDTQIAGWVSSFLLPLFRIAAVLMVMPIIGTQLVPQRIRLYMALAITLLLVPVLPAMPQVEMLSLQSILLIAEQIIIGAMLGFSLQLFFHIFVFAGQ